MFILLSYTLRQWQLWTAQAQDLADRSPAFMGRRLNRYKHYVVIYRAYAYAQITLWQFTREVLQLEGPARQKALVKVRQLEESLLNPFDNTS